MSQGWWEGEIGISKESEGGRNDDAEESRTRG